MARILVVEPDPDELTALSDLLTQNGYEVIEAKGGGQGVNRALTKEQPDLVCLNLLMPGKSGIKMYQRMKKHNKLKNIPVMIIADPEITKPDFRSFAHGGARPAPEGYIEKPIDTQEFLDTVQALLQA